MVTGFQIVNPNDGAFTPVVLEDGMTIKLSEMPSVFTVQALVEDGVTEVKFEVNDAQVKHDHTADFAFTDGEFSQLYVEGTYKLAAYATDGTWESKDEECSITVVVEYANKNVCEGLITNFALYDTAAQAIVPGYEVLGDGQDLDLADLPDQLSIIAVDNGRGGGEVSFYLNDDTSPMTTTSGTPYAITGLDSGAVPEWTQLRETGSYTISAKMKDRLGVAEPAECKITVDVRSDWICLNEIVGYSLINTETNEVVPGYDHMAGARVIDLATVPEFLSLRINKKHATNRGTQIFLNSRPYRTENHLPYALNGDNSGDYHASDLLSTPGVYHFLTRGKRHDRNRWENRGDGCELDLTVVDSSEPKVSIPPETTLRLIDNDDGVCAPKLVTPVTAGNHQYFSTPVKVEAIRTDETVSFQVYNYIHESTMDWITTAFVTPSGVEVCDKVANVPFESNTVQVYEAKCHDGFAYADVFAYSTIFSPEHISADTSMLPTACKNDYAGKVVRYTFVFSCNCEETPEVPDEITGGVPVEEMSCAGSVGNSWGDPHVVPFDGGQWDCQGTGEFVLAKATLNDYAYDFEAHTRYWRFDRTGINYSFTTGLAMKQDVTVQLTIAEKVYPYSTMFADLPVNFYVDGVPRLLTQGSGDHRVIATVDGFNVMLFFVSTGIAATIHVRPNSVSGHIIDIPGSLTTYICLPDDNPDIVDVMGLLGTPNEDLSDDWMDVNGNTINKGSTNAFDYCTNTWCIRDEAQSLFTYDEGYDFAHYERCDDGKNTRHLEEATPEPSDKVKEICAAVDDNEGCLLDGANGGVPAAEIAVEAITGLNNKKIESKKAMTTDDVACCSSDFKTCDAGCSDKKHQCATCREGETFRWLPHGPYVDPYNEDPEVVDPHADCLAKTTQCDVGADECCPGLDCVDGTCLPSDDSTGRRLKEFVFTRPDLPSERIIIPYSEL